MLAAGWTDAGGGDIKYVWGAGVSRADSHLLHVALFVGAYNLATRTFDKSFMRQLEERGYDLTTLRFSIAKKRTPTPPTEATDDGQ